MTVGGSTAEMKSWEKGMYELWFRSKSKFSSLYSWTDDFTNPWLDGGRQKQIRIKPCSLSIRINPSKFNHGSMRSSLLSKVVGWGRTEWVWKRHGWTRMDWCGLISTNSNGQLMAQKRTGNGCGFIWSNRGGWTNAVGWRKNSTNKLIAHSHPKFNCQRWMSEASAKNVCSSNLRSKFCFVLNLKGLQTVDAWFASGDSNFLQSSWPGSRNDFQICQSELFVCNPDTNWEFPQSPLDRNRLIPVFYGPGKTGRLLILRATEVNALIDDSSNLQKHFLPSPECDPFYPNSEASSENGSFCATLGSAAELPRETSSHDRPDEAKLINLCIFRH